MISTRLDVYHHYPIMCKTCGYVSDNGRLDREGMNRHIIHTVENSLIFIDKIKESEKDRKKK